jgi:hypothetical protein
MLLFQTVQGTAVLWFLQLLSIISRCSNILTQNAGSKDQHYTRLQCKLEGVLAKRLHYKPKTMPTAVSQLLHKNLERLSSWKWQNHLMKQQISISSFATKCVSVTVPRTPGNGTHSKHSLLLVHDVHYMFSVCLVFIQCSSQSALYLLLIQVEDVGNILILKIA